jgi:hypothetical protein
MKLGKWMRQKRTKSRKYPEQENTTRKIGTAFTNNDKYSRDNYKDLQGHKDNVAYRTDNNIRQQLREHENTKPYVCIGLYNYAWQQYKQSYIDQTDGLPESDKPKTAHRTNNAKSANTTHILRWQRTYGKHQEHGKTGKKFGRGTVIFQKFFFQPFYQFFSIVFYIYIYIYIYTHTRGGVVVKAGRGFDSRWCHWNFSVT